MASGIKQLYPYNGELVDFEKPPEEYQKRLAVICAKVIEGIILETLKIRGGIKMNWLTPQQVAEQLQVTRNKVYDLLKDGIIPHVKVGDLYRIPENYSENLLDVTTKPRLRLAKGNLKIGR